MFVLFLRGCPPPVHLRATTFMSPPAAGGRVQGRAVLRWLALSLVAIALGASIGAAYAFTMKPPQLSEEGAPSPFDDVTPPTAPEPLLEPADGATVRTSAPELVWTPSKDDRDGFIYVVEISFDADFASVSRVYSNILEPRWQIPPDEPLAPGVQAYWRVQAIDVGLNASPYSSTFSFTPLGVFSDSP